MIGESGDSLALLMKMIVRLFRSGTAFGLLAFLGVNLGLVSKAEVLTFEYVLEQAIAHSYDLKIAETGIAISQTRITEARAEYFPQIRGRLNSEYQKDLTGNGALVSTVGDTILPAGTRFQNSVNLQVT